jgi:hypothetical protein
MPSLSDKNSSEGSILGGIKQLVQNLFGSVRYLFFMPNNHRHFE